MSVKNRVFISEGKPFVEISLNKFGRLWQLIDPLFRGDVSGYFSRSTETEATKLCFERQLEEIVDSGVQPAYWRAYGSARPGEITGRAGSR